VNRKPVEGTIAYIFGAKPRTFAPTFFNIPPKSVIRQACDIANKALAAGKLEPFVADIEGREVIIDPEYGIHFPSA
jgi:hypothetical protein